MDKHNIYTLKGILLSDVIIGMIIYLLIKSTIFSDFAEIIFLGLIVAYINLAVSSFYAKRMFKNKWFIFSYLLMQMVGIVGTAYIAYIFYLTNSFSSLFFLGGYCTHFIALVLIAFKDLIKT
ncbi:MAG: hypothetical protein GX895_00550 [Clostridiales bacterium]|nr:hypothetical protein [Clostridiales bacterium]